MSEKKQLQFTAEDFSAFFEQRTLRNYACEAAEIANARLAEMLAAAPVVYALKYRDTFDGTRGWTTHYMPGYDTHRARLVDVEELKP
jgi:hypothetical protein